MRTCSVRDEELDYTLETTLSSSVKWTCRIPIHISRIDISTVPDQKFDDFLVSLLNCQLQTRYPPIIKTVRVGSLLQEVVDGSNIHFFYGGQKLAREIF